ncbi:MAG: lipopolysaccharide biosynthesis protein, partial [Sulfolobus sp.]|nr:lipopolysaccharide biosynthesis protein [Sulfolobus sp.]
VLLIFPDYVRLAIPYLFLYVANAVENAEMIGMDMFKESTISGFLFLTIRWGISIIAVLQKDIYLFLALWTVGAIISNSFNLFMISRKLGGAVFPSFNIPFVLSHFRKALSLYLSNIIGFLSSQGDRVTTSYLLGSYYLGLYQFSALVGGVPSMFLGSIRAPLLSASSYYKALGKDEKFMSSVTFKFASLLTFLVVIISLPLARILIPILFPDYAKAINVLTILLLLSTLPFPIGTLTTFIVAFKRSLKPFFYITLATASTVLITSYVLIPTMGIMGGAISQLLSALISSAFVLYYSVSTKVFFPSGKEFFLLSLIPLLGFYEYFIDPLWLDVIALLGVVIVFKVLKIIRKDEAKIVSSFLPKWLRFLEFIILGISS